MRRTVRIVKAGDRIGHDLDAPGGGLEGVALRITTEIFKQDIIALGRRQLDEALRPELLEAGQIYALCCGARPHLIVDQLAPSHLIAVLGEGAFITEAPGQGAENIEVIPCAADGIDGAMHGQHERVAR